MTSLRRCGLLFAVTLAAMAAAAIPAFAKGPGDGPPVTSVVVLGPGMRTPALFQGDQAIDISRGAGMLRAIDESVADRRELIPPTGSALGPRFEVTYVVSYWVAHTLGTDGASVTQDLYPFAKGGPWAFTPPDQGLRASGWWPVSNDVVQTLETAGVHGPTAARTTTTALPSTSWSWIWALGIAAASVALIGLVDVLVTRSKRRATIV